MDDTLAPIKNNEIPLLALLRENGRLSLVRATRAEREIQRIARFSLLGDHALIRPEELAVILDCSVRFIAKMREAGRLPATFRIGQLVRWRLVAVRYWIWSRCEVPPPGTPRVIETDAWISIERV